MDQTAIAADLEARADKVGVPIYTVCEQAGIAPSTFYRWRNGKGGGTIAKLNAVQRELSRLEALA